MTRKHFRALLLLALLVLCALGPASASEEKEEQAVAAALAWLALVDAGDYDQSWETAAAYFRNAVAKEKWHRMLTAVRRPLGALVSRDLASKAFTRTLPGAPDGDYVVIRFDASYENKASAIETVTPMRDSDGQWRVSGYFIK